MAALIGLIALSLFWLGALAAVAWSWDRYLQRSLAVGVDISQEHRELNTKRVIWLNVRRHTVGWTLFYFSFFFALGLVGLPVWQRLGIGCLLALYYGYLRASTETHQDGDRLPLFSSRTDKAWYFTILSAEWLGYYGVLIFAGEVIVAVVK